MGRKHMYAYIGLHCAMHQKKCGKISCLANGCKTLSILTCLNDTRHFNMDNSIISVINLQFWLFLGTAKYHVLKPFSSV